MTPLFYVIRRHDDGKFVTPSGSLRAYTTNVMKAKRFASADAARVECCGNESPYGVE